MKLFFSMMLFLLNLLPFSFIVVAAGHNGRPPKDDIYAQAHLRGTNAYDSQSSHSYNASPFIGDRLTRKNTPRLRSHLEHGESVSFVEICVLIVEGASSSLKTVRDGSPSIKSTETIFQSIGK